MKKLAVFFILFLLAIAIFSFAKFSGNSVKNVEAKTPITIYKSSSCGCCGLYTSYLNKNDFDVKVVDMSDISLSNTKKEYKIPQYLQSCHTSIVGDYFVEGHIPKEAIVKLLNEKPDIVGIAMPGMPSGSPGMPGGKTSDFVISAVNKDGSSYEFMRL